MRVTLCALWDRFDAETHRCAPDDIVLDRRVYQGDLWRWVRHARIHGFPPT